MAPDESQPLDLTRLGSESRARLPAIVDSIELIARTVDPIELLSQLAVAPPTYPDALSLRAFAKAAADAPKRFARRRA